MLMGEFGDDKTVNKRQKDIIRQKATVSEWKQPESQDVIVRHVVFDVHELLPDANIEAFLKECPRSAQWQCLECDGSLDDWYFSMPEEQNLWVSTVAISKPGQIKNAVLEQLKYDKTESAIIALILKLEELTDYTYRKTEEEIKSMQEETQRVFAQGHD